MNRQSMLAMLDDPPRWEVVVIGGGATGLGTAVEAASRGYRTLLLEQHDFSKGTSSRSTKLIHGGIRYLRQGNISLVLEALQERGLLIQNAPHLVHHQSFIVPSYDWWSGPFYGVGLKVYDLMAGKLGLGPSKMLTREEALQLIPTLEPEGLKGGTQYFDGQFDDSRLAVNLAQTAAELGAAVINYMPVIAFLKEREMVRGVVAVDLESEKEYQIRANVVINATGIFTDHILRLDNPSAGNLLSLSQGVHLVLRREFLPGDSAIMVPHTEDGRVLFAVPWHDKVVVGTTDTPIEEAKLEPSAQADEISFILKHAGRYLSHDPLSADIQSIFTGIRPLVHPEGSDNTAAISRDHHLLISESGLVTITGGKWTTYRKMAEDTINQAALIGDLEEKPCITRTLKIHGYTPAVSLQEPLWYYGSDARGLREIVRQHSERGEKIHPALPYIRAEVIWAVREEMARTVEDVLARRTRALFLDARAAREAARPVAEMMARELGRSGKWVDRQVADFRELTGIYLPASASH